MNVEPNELFNLKKNRQAILRALPECLNPVIEAALKYQLFQLDRLIEEKEKANEPQKKDN